MPREEILHDLPDEEKICDRDGHALVEIGRETSEQLELIVARGNDPARAASARARTRCAPT